ncbi:MAG: hypothetical protein BroJett038_33610 [Chloroflexota bacterium]|nr:MAG: hypothetical protein BroJett038_33610 [Chloroflexota bacterium]
MGQEKDTPPHVIDTLRQSSPHQHNIEGSIQAARQGLVVNRYELLGKLGQGGMGTVYKVRDRLNGDVVALKQVNVPTVELAFSSMGSDSDGTLALATEFRTLAGMRHPHIVSVLDYGFDRNRMPFYTMQYLAAAKSITDYGAALDTAGKVHLVIQMLQALIYLHRRGVFHRDLKPANVQVIADGSVKVMDFGLAVNYRHSASVAVVEGVAGTLAYMAPEMFAENPASVQSDLYAVGVILYELFAGRHPYNTKNVASLISSVMTTSPDMTLFDAPLATVISRLLAKTPAERYESAAETIAVLCDATGQPLPEESVLLRESFLQASDFIGRENELNTLKSALHQALNGKGSAWLVGGESGVGKSRLLDELRTRALVRGGTVLRGQAVAEGGLPYHVWREPLRGLALSVEMSDLEAATLKALVPDIGDLVGRIVPDAPALEGRPGISRLVLTITDVFKRLCDRSPVVLLLEDLHWADESLEPLRTLNRFVADQSLLIVATYRDDEHSRLPEELPGMQILRLQRLSDEAILELSESMLGEVGKLPHVVDLLRRETEGNTFFIVEVVRALAEEAGRLSEVGRRTLPERLMVGGIQQIVRRRLGRVPEAQRAWLKRAAVLGRELDRKVLLRLMETPEAPDAASRLEAWLNICADAAVLEVEEDRWRFSHDKLREAMLADLTAEERQTLNRQVAEAIEAVYPDDSSRAAVLMEYWAAAGNLLKEGHYAALYAEQLSQRSDYRAIAALVPPLRARLSDQNIPEADGILVHLLRYLGAAYRNMSHNAKAKEAYETSLALARKLNDRVGEANALHGLGTVETDLSNYAASQVYYEDSLAIQKALQDREGMSRAISSLGIIAYLQGDYEKARAYWRESLALGREIGHPVRIAGSLINLGSASLVLGERETARACWEESLATMRQVGDRLGIANSLQGLGNIARDLGDYQAARAYYEEGMLLLRDIGNRQSLAQIIHNLGEVMHFQGDIEAARAACEESLSVRRAIDDKSGIASALASLGNLAYTQRDYATARRYYDESMSIYREVGNRGGVVNQAINIAFLRLAEDPVDAGVRQAFQDVLKQSDEMGAVETLLEAIIGFAWLRLRQEQADACAGLLGLVQAHPAYTSGLRFFRAEPLLTALQAALPPHELEAAITRGQMLDLAEVLRELLDEAE